MAPTYQQPPPEDWGRAPPRVVYAEPQQSVERLTMPVVLVVSVVAFAAWATWWGTSAVNDIQSSVKDIGQALTNYIVRADNRVTRIEEALEKRTQERWTRRDHELWCLRTERENQAWKCGPTHGLGAELTDPPIWDGARGVVEGWQPRTKKP